jgi:hypothetical protein
MSNSPEEFEKLRKLLRIKQHEQPPPGYFNNFSGLVISRIEREGGADAAWSEVPWLRRLFGMFERSPMIGGLFGSALCGVVILGIVLANQVDKVDIRAYRPPGLANNNTLQADSATSLSPAFGAAADTSVRSTDAMFGSGSNAVSSSVTASVEPVSFTTTAPH